VAELNCAVFVSNSFIPSGIYGVTSCPEDVFGIHIRYHFTINSVYFLSGIHNDEMKFFTTLLLV
jgi:hypothetical protein